MPSPEDPVVHKLAASLAEGTPIDWSAAESGASTPSQRAIVESLRTLAAVADAHANGDRKSVV